MLAVPDRSANRRPSSDSVRCPVLRLSLRLCLLTSLVTEAFRRQEASAFTTESADLRKSMEVAKAATVAISRVLKDFDGLMKTNAKEI